MPGCWPRRTRPFPRTDRPTHTPRCWRCRTPRRGRPLGPLWGSRAPGPARACPRAPTRARRSVVAHQLLVFAVDRDHRLPLGQCRLDRLVDVLKLGVVVGMLGTLPRLLVGLQAKPLRLQKLPERPLGDLMPHPHQRHAQLPEALGRPPQRRLGIAARGRIDQPIQILNHQRIRLDHRPTATTRPAHLPALDPLAGLNLGQPAPDRLLREPSHTRKQRHTTRPMRLGLARRPQPPAALVTLRAEQTPALRDLRLRQTISAAANRSGSGTPLHSPPAPKPLSITQQTPHTC